MKKNRLVNSSCAELPEELAQVLDAEIWGKDTRSNISFSGYL